MESKEYINVIGECFPTLSYAHKFKLPRPIPPRGYHPLAMSRNNGGWILSSWGLALLSVVYHSVSASSIPALLHPARLTVPAVQALSWTAMNILDFASVIR